MFFFFCYMNLISKFKSPKQLPTKSDTERVTLSQTRVAAAAFCRRSKVNKVSRCSLTESNHRGNSRVQIIRSHRLYLYLTLSVASRRQVQRHQTSATCVVARLSLSD